LTDDDWVAHFPKSIGVFLNGDAIDDVDANGEHVTDDSFLLLFNAHDGSVPFVLPGPELGERWTRLLDTAGPDAAVEGVQLKAGEETVLESHSLVVLQRLSLS
jgi:glycogen operon protein